MANKEPEANTVESKTAAEYLDPYSAAEPSEETGPGTHFHNTFDPAMKEEAPRMPETLSAREKLATTSSRMTTAQLQAAAAEGDPNNLLQPMRPKKK